MRPDLVEFLRLPHCRPFPLPPHPAPGICTTEIFEGFNFINDQAVPATSPFGSSAAPSILPLVLLPPFTRRPSVDSNEYRISWPGKGGKCVRDGRKLADAVATVNRRDRGEDDERKNFVSINNSDPVLRRRNPPTVFPFHRFA